MAEGKSRQEIREQLEAHLNSPLPILIRLRNIVFGKNKPDTYTRISFYFALVVWFIFFLWSILGMIVIESRHWIKEEKKIDVTLMIEHRGQELGFSPYEFAERLSAFHTASMICWIVALGGLVMMYRKRFNFVYLFFGGCGVYLLMMWFMLGFGYWINDTTTFDKITFFLMTGHTALYAFFLKQELLGTPVNFFGVKTEDENA